MPRLHVTQIITGLPRGGAQRMLYYLLERYDRDRFSMDVVSLTELGAVGKALQSAGIPTIALGMNRTLPNPADVWRLAAHLRRNQTDVVQTWLYHGDLIGGLAGRLAGRPTIWNIRQSDLAPRTTKLGTLLTARACAWLSGLAPKHIICCSEASRVVHSALGYDAGKMSVIGNGVDFSTFCPDRAAGAEVRGAAGIQPDVPVIGLVARFHSQKDHKTFVRAAAALAEIHANVQFVLCGEGVEPDNATLSGWISDLGLSERFHLLGARDDVQRVYNMLTIATLSSSYGEGFPNVLAEAMACGVPCVTTDIGDSAFIVGNTGAVVQPGDPVALAEAWAKILELDDKNRAALGAVACRRAVETFRLEDVIERYQILYEQMASSGECKTGQT